jgi:phosphinothricin acetyltransferase
MEAIRLRTASLDDATAVAEIYRPYVEETPITFEATPPDADAVAERIRETLETHPWFVAERDGRTIGYAYASRLRDRPAYRWRAELSVYLDRRERGRGVGSALYRALLATLDRQGFRSAYGVVTLPNPESVAFHESFGFERVARFPEVGHKLGEWHDVAWYERPLGERSDDSPDPTPFAECRDAEWLAATLSEAVDGDTDR